SSFPCVAGRRNPWIMRNNLWLCIPLSIGLLVLEGTGCSTDVPSGTSEDAPQDAALVDGAADGNPQANAPDGGLADAPLVDGGALDATVTGDDATAPSGPDARADAAADGAAPDARAANDASAEAGTAYAYVGTFLAGIWGYSIDTSTGTPTLIGDAAVDFGAQIYSLAVYPGG